MGGGEKIKKRKGKFLVLRVRFTTPKRLANKFTAYAVALAVSPQLAHLALPPDARGFSKVRSPHTPPRTARSQSSRLLLGVVCIRSVAWL